MYPLPLQSALDCYTSSGDKLTCVLGDLTAATGGEAAFGLLVGGVVIASMYIAGDGGFATPATLTTLAGGLLFPVLPGNFQGIALSMVVLGLAAGLLAVAEKYLMDPGTA